MAPEGHARVRERRVRRGKAGLGEIRSVMAPRANWCPSAPVDAVEIDLADLGTPGEHAFSFAIEGIADGVCGRRRRSSTRTAGEPPSEAAHFGPHIPNPLTWGVMAVLLPPLRLARPSFVRDSGGPGGALQPPMRTAPIAYFLLPLALTLASACGDTDNDPSSTDTDDNTDSASTLPDTNEDSTETASATATEDSDPSMTDSATTQDPTVADSGDTSSDSTTGNIGEPGTPVDLGDAGNFAILAKSGISTVPPSVITGDIGVSPMSATSITGFSLTLDATEAFSTSSQITGNVYAADYAEPTPTNLTTAVLDMELAFTDAAGRAPDVTELGAGNIGGMTLEAGVYRWGTGLLIPTDLTLDGNSTDVWIFQVAQDLNMSSATSIVLTGGALADNVFWQVSGSVDIGTTAHCEGNVLSMTTARLGTGASIVGRLLAQTAVTLDGNTVVETR